MKFSAQKLATSTGIGLAAIIMIACGSGDSSSLDSEGAEPGPSGPSAAKEGKQEAPEGVYKFGQTAKFEDGSTLKVGKAVKFKPDEYAATGEKRPVYVKFKATFTNKTTEVFDPSLTTASASAEGEEGESVYQDGLGTPSNKVLPGKSVSWWMGYGVKGQKEMQLEIDVGFLDYDAVVFTN